MSENSLLNGSIGRVNIFNNIVRIEKDIECEVSAGESEVIVGGFPLKILDSSVRAKVLERNAKVVFSQVLLDVHDHARSLTELGEDIVKLRRKKEKLNFLYSQLEKRGQFLRGQVPKFLSLHALPDSLAQKVKSPLATWRDASIFFTDTVDQLNIKLIKIMDDIDNLSDQLEKLENDYQYESRRTLDETLTFKKSVKLKLKASEAGKIKIEVSYLAPTAKWYPKYELHINTKTQDSQFKVLSSLAQATGEDWQGVKLKLTTAELMTGIQIPELPSWRIGRGGEPAKQAWKELNDSLDGMYRDFDGGYDPGYGSSMYPDIDGSHYIKSLPDRFYEFGEAESFSKSSRQTSTRSVTPAPKKKTAPPTPSYHDEIEEDLDDDDLLDEGTGSFEAPKMMMANSLDLGGFGDDEEMEMSADMSEMSKSSARIGGKISAKKSAPRSMRAKRKTSVDVSFGSEIVEEMPLEEGFIEEDKLLLGEDALNYQSLVLHGPENHSLRGELHQKNSTDDLMESLKRSKRKYTSEQINEAQACFNVARSREMDVSTRDSEVPRYSVAVNDSRGEFALTYEVSTPVNLKADGHYLSVPIDNFSTSVEKVYRCNPSVENHVFEFVKMKNEINQPFLQGPLKVFKDGDFVVDTPLDFIPHKGDFSVNTGVEAGIKVARNVFFSEETSGLLNNKSEIKHKVEIEVTSLLDEDVQMEVFECIPVSDDKDISVKILNAVPDVTDYDQHDIRIPVRGGKVFKFSLPAKQKIKCELEYIINIPQDEKLVGGNRRG